MQSTASLSFALSMVIGAAAAIAGWTPGDVVCVSSSSGIGPGARPGVLLIHPSPISVSAVKADSGITGDGAFDPSRNRVVLVRTGAFGRIISLLDSDGAMTDLTYGGNQDAQIVAPTGDGRIYFVRPNKISYIDAAGTTHDVLDVSGPGVFVPTRVWRRIYFDPATKALFLGGNSGINALITKIALTPDGTRLASAPNDTLFVTAQLSAPSVVGFSTGPAGKIFIKLDDNSGNTAPRMLLMEPFAIDITPFANSGYFGVGGEIAGCYSPALNAAMVLDSLSDKLRVFTLNATGEGVATNAPLVSSGGGSGENALMFSITASIAACPGDINKDGQVDDADFTFFVQAYNVLDCADPAMPAGCPADFNHDGFVDDADFTIFVVAYNNLICP